MPPPFTYPVGPNSPDSHQLSPRWTMAVIRLEHINPLDEEVVAKAATQQYAFDVSIKGMSDRAVAEREPLLLSTPVINWSISESKSSAVAAANFTLAPMMAFDREICSGDWVLFWVHPNETHQKRIQEKVFKGLTKPEFSEPVNGAMDGLRFIGRCSSPRESFSVDPATGTPRTEYSMSAIGFGELNSSIFFTQAYQQYLSEQTSNVGLISNVNELYSRLNELNQDPTIAVKIRDYFFIFLGAFLGPGPEDNVKGFNPQTKTAIEPLELPASRAFTPNDAFLVPATVGSLLGKSSLGLTYRDLLSTAICVQAPAEATGIEGMIINPLTENGNPVEPKGAFTPQFTDFSGVSIMRLLQRFANIPVNEVFTSLRLTSEGVLPSLVVRQNPFVSKTAAKGLSEVHPVVPFADLPRWELDDWMVTGGELGASDAQRVNYVSVEGTDPKQDVVDIRTWNQQNAPHMANLTDVRRNGVRPYVVHTSADISGFGESAETAKYIGKFYTAIVADTVFKQHLKWSGTLKCTGILEPVAVGDNIQFRDLVLHVEGRTDTGRVGANGQRRWETSFTVADGISTATDKSDSDVFPQEAKAIEHQHEYVSHPHSILYTSSEFEGVVSREAVTLKIDESDLEALKVEAKESDRTNRRFGLTDEDVFGR